MNIRRFRDRQDLVDQGFDDFPGVSTRCDLPVPRTAQCRDGVQRTVPSEFGPKLTGDIVRDAASNSSSFKHARDALSLRIAWAYDKITASDVLHASRLGNGRRNINHGGQRFKA